MSALTPQYLAGLIDGEGCISKSNGNCWVVSVAMNQTAEKLLLKVHSEFGGKFRSYAYRHGIMYSWKLENKSDINRVLTLVLPYMLLDYKIEKCNCALEWARTTNKNADHLNVRISSFCVDCGNSLTTNFPNRRRTRCDLCKQRHRSEYWALVGKYNRKGFVNVSINAT